MPTSKIEEALARQLEDVAIPFKREYKFLPNRRFRFDFAIPDLHIAIECEGGLYGKPVKCNVCKSIVRRRTRTGAMMVVTEGGRHNSAAGYKADAEKYNLATLNGWRVLRFTKDHVKSREAVDMILALVKKEENNDNNTRDAQ